MDPNAALEYLRSLVRDALADKEFPPPTPTVEEAYARITDMAQTVDAIDTWISSGGFLPADWQVETKVPQ